MANWAQFRNFHLGVKLASRLDINGCVELFWGDSKFTLLHKLYTHYSSVNFVDDNERFDDYLWFLTFLSKNK